MGRHFSHLHSAVKAIEQYDGSMPFNNSIKAFFAKEKKYGSKDRKQIATLCYSYFRSGHLFKTAETGEKIIASVFLSQQSPNDFLAELKPDWAQQIGLSFPEKLAMLNKNIEQLFPFVDSLSREVDGDLFVASLFVQPALFIRVRPGKLNIVEQKLKAAAVPFALVSDDCLSLPNSTKAEEILLINKEVVIQDLNSQKVFDYLKTNEVSGDHASAWDCCAASGGKSILLYDRLQGKVRITVTDIRETILSRLHTRLSTAGIKIENSYLTDLTRSGLPSADSFDIIVCDVPCTGSGTWSRTPEQMYYFHQSRIQTYAAMQRQIITNSMGSLKKGALFFYITCSVFAEENDEQVKFINKNFSVKPVLVAYYKGYEHKADTMFVAVFKS